jgi:hypothetical protein
MGFQTCRAGSCLQGSGQPVLLALPAGDRSRLDQHLQRGVPELTNNKCSLVCDLAGSGVFDICKLISHCAANQLIC